MTVGTTSAYRVAAGAAIATAILLLWVVGAVGLIGAEGDPADLAYARVLTTPVIGSSIARWRSLGMARAVRHGGRPGARCRGRADDGQTGRGQLLAGENSVASGAPTPVPTRLAAFGIGLGQRLVWFVPAPTTSRPEDGSRVRATSRVSPRAESSASRKAASFSRGCGALTGRRFSRRGPEVN